MNCLLLLIILFCCNGNVSCGNMGCNNAGCGTARCNTRGRNNVGCNMSREIVGERSSGRRECDCEAAPSGCTHTPPPMPRTQFPYLDVEPRTCGCEEKANN